MNYTSYTDTERMTLDAHRTLNRAQEALTASKHFRRFAEITKGNLKDADLTAAAIEAADVSFKLLLKAAANVSITKRKLQCSVHSMKIEEAE